jgi:hypothetical protein
MCKKIIIPRRREASAVLPICRATRLSARQLRVVVSEPSYFVPVVSTALVAPRSCDREDFETGPLLR